MCVCLPGVYVCVCVQVGGFCKLMSDFSMEYRTTHDKIMARLERKKHEKERKKTKGKFIVSLIPLAHLLLHGMGGWVGGMLGGAKVRS